MNLIAIEFGMGADIHGRDVNKAIHRAISDAIRHCSLTFFNKYSYPNLMVIEIDIGVQDPKEVDLETVKNSIPFGKVKINVVKGGLDDNDMGGNNDITIASVGLKVFLKTEKHPF